MKKKTRRQKEPSSRISLTILEPPLQPILRLRLSPSNAARMEILVVNMVMEIGQSLIHGLRFTGQVKVQRSGAMPSESPRSWFALIFLLDIQGYLFCLFLSPLHKKRAP